MSNNLQSPEFFMQAALDEARRATEFGEVPIGAVVVQNGEIISRAHNWRETWRDPSAHAELLAIQEASRRLGGWRLENCDLYVTLEPCPMCAGAIVLSRIRKIWFGAVDAKGGAVVSKTNLFADGQWNHIPQFEGGILEKDCAIILKDFFKAIRTKK